MDPGVQPHSGAGRASWTLTAWAEEEMQLKYPVHIPVQGTGMWREGQTDA